MAAFAETDERWMRAALALARRGLGRTWPNPAVGCVIVQNGVTVGQGWTQPGGRPHAETQALDMAGARAEAATVYVSLEPCSHHGRTPPCAAALIDAGVSRVVVACGDPDPRVSGRGFAALRRAGVAVTHGVLADQAKAINRGFMKRHQEGLPLVTLKLATTLDARIATVTGESQWITGPEARRYGHYLRATHDAIMVGRGTVDTDNPSLTCRVPGMADRSPIRVYLDTRGSVAGPLHLLSGEGPPVWRLTAATTEPLPDVDDLRVPLTDGGTLDMTAALRLLADRGITRLLVEGGGTLVASLIRNGLVDRIEWARASSIAGGDGLPAIAPFGVRRIADMQGFTLVETRALGDDVLSVYELA